MKRQILYTRKPASGSIEAGVIDVGEDETIIFTEVIVQTVQGGFTKVSLKVGDRLRKLSHVTELKILEVPT